VSHLHYDIGRKMTGLRNWQQTHAWTQTQPQTIDTQNLTDVPSTEPMTAKLQKTGK